MPTTKKRQPKKKPLTCPVCKQKFYHGAKSHPMQRMSKHLWSKHRDYMTKKIKTGQKKKKREIRPLDKEFMQMDDLIVSVLMDELQHRQGIQHESIGGKALSTLSSPWGMLGEYLLSTLMKTASGQVPKRPALRALFGYGYDLFGGDYVPKKKKR